MATTRKFPNGKLAFVIALAVLSLVGAFLYFVHPGGFEGQGAWFIVLLPGTVVSYVLTDVIDKVAPRAGEMFFWATVVGLNLLLYWGITYRLVKSARRSGPGDGF
jgi:hypothetical protein